MNVKICKDCGHPYKITDAQLMKEYAMEAEIFHLKLKVTILNLRIVDLETAALPGPIMVGAAA